jgi:RNA polymerase sigma-70 factor (ECF subfamily)
MMTSTVKLDPENIDALLRAWSRGDLFAREQVWPIVFQQLRRLARRQLDRENTAHSLESCALVNEAFLRLNDLSCPQWETGAQFFAMCAKVMRHVLVDHARAHQCLKRPDSRQKISLDGIVLFTDEKSEQLLALHEALTQLAKIHPRKSDVVEMRFFGGLSEDEIAEVLQVSSMTVKRDWRFARAWLETVLNGEIPDESSAAPTL